MDVAVDGTPYFSPTAYQEGRRDFNEEKRRNFSAQWYRCRDCKELVHRLKVRLIRVDGGKNYRCGPCHEAYWDRMLGKAV